MFLLVLRIIYVEKYGKVIPNYNIISAFKVYYLYRCTPTDRGKNAPDKNNKI